MRDENITLTTVQRKVLSKFSSESKLLMNRLSWILDQDGVLWIDVQKKPDSSFENDLVKMYGMIVEGFRVSRRGSVHSTCGCPMMILEGASILPTKKF